MSRKRVHHWFFQTGLGLVVALGLMWAGTALALQAQGDITTSTTWGEDVELTGVVSVKAPAVLTVLPGVTVYGNPQTALIIEQGAKIMAIGTPEEPIVFTSNKPAGSRARGDWGGISINGYAPINNAGGSCPDNPQTAVGEAGMGVYGGCNSHDNSGTLRYVRIEYGGYRMDGENEWNALTLQGVGDETIIEYVQCDQNDDDGIEFFGGTVDVRNILNSRCADDHFDWTNGFTGKAQFIVAHKADDDGDRGIEGDNLKADNSAQPVSNPTIYNMTLVGNKNIPDGGGEGIVFRRGTGITLKNSIVTGFQKAAVDIDNEATFAGISSGDLVIDNCIFYDNLDGAEFNADEGDEPDFTPSTTTQNFVMNTMQHNRTVNPELNSISIQSPDLRPDMFSPAFAGAAAVPADGFFVENADFIGAFDSEYDWTKGWTTFGSALATMPVPSSFLEYWYHPQHYPYTSANPELARPISFGFMERGKLDFRIGLHAFAAPMDIYIGFMLPDGSIYTFDENLQGHGVADMQPWRRSQTHSVYENLLSASGISWSHGFYAGFVLAVPAGTNVAAMSIDTPGYFWGFLTTI
jgi:hypothetical protein